MGDIKYLAVTALFVPATQWFLGLVISGLVGLFVFLIAGLTDKLPRCDENAPANENLTVPTRVSGLRSLSKISQNNHDFQHAKIPFGPIIFVSYLPIVCEYWARL